MEHITPHVNIAVYVFALNVKQMVGRTAQIVVVLRVTSYRVGLNMLTQSVLTLLFLTLLFLTLFFLTSLFLTSIFLTVTMKFRKIIMFHHVTEVVAKHTHCLVKVVGSGFVLIANVRVGDIKPTACVSKVPYSFLTTLLLLTLHLILLKKALANFV